MFIMKNYTLTVTYLPKIMFFIISISMVLFSTNTENLDYNKIDINCSKSALSDIDYNKGCKIIGCDGVGEYNCGRIRISGRIDKEDVIIDCAYIPAY